MLEVSLTGFENIGDVHVINQVKKKYPNEHEIIKRINDQIIPGKKPNITVS